MHELIYGDVKKYFEKYTIEMQGKFKYKLEFFICYQSKFTPQYCYIFYFVCFIVVKAKFPFQQAIKKSTIQRNNS